MEEELKKRVKEYELEDYVHFLGYQKSLSVFISDESSLVYV